MDRVMAINAISICTVESLHIGIGTMNNFMFLLISIAIFLLLHFADLDKDFPPFPKTTWHIPKSDVQISPFKSGQFELNSFFRQTKAPDTILTV